MSDTGRESRAGESSPELKRTIGPTLLLFFIVGDILGAGIYALVGEVGARVGGAIWTAFLFALILAVFTAFAYAELVTKYPRAGGAATYINRAFGVPFASFMVTFAVAMSGLTSASTLSIAFGGDYLSQFIAIPTIVAAIVFIIAVGLLNFRGISESVKVNFGLTLVEVVGLVLIVLVGVVALATGVGEPSRNFEFSGESSVPITILAGAALSFYALIGFEDSVNVAEETLEPRTAYPRALFGGLLVAGVIYLLVTFTASMVVPTGQLAGSSAPLLEVVSEGPVPIPLWLFALIALLAVANGALINMIMASRLIYGMSRQGIVPRIFSRVHPGRRTPHIAIIFTTLIVMALITFGTIAGDALSTLASTTVLLLLLVFITVNISVLVLRRDRVEHDHFKAPTVFPVLGVIVCLGLLTQQDGRTWLIAGALLLFGVVLYFVNVAVKRSVDHETPSEAQER